MAKLTSKERKSIPKKDFALPGKRSKSGGKGGYPIEDAAHARSALSRVSQFGTPEEKKEVREKVQKKYPDIGKSKKKAGDRGDRREERGAERRGR